MRNAPFAKRLIIGLTVLLTGLPVAVASAQTLADHMPGDAIIYAEWVGMGGLDAMSKGTPYGELMADPGVSKLFDEVVRAVGALVRQEAGKEGEGELADSAMQLFHLLLTRPAAVSILGVTMTEQGPSPEMVAVLDAGDEDAAGKFVQTVEQLIVKSGELPPPQPVEAAGHSFKQVMIPFAPPIRFGAVGRHVLLTVGDGATAKAVATLNGDGKKASDDENLVAAMKRIGTENRKRWELLHIDVQRIISQARQVFQAMTQADTLPPLAESLLAETGVDRLRSITGLWQVDGNGFRESWYVALPPKDGRPKWLFQKPITDDELKMVPQDATFAKVANCRLLDLYDGIMHIVDTIGPMAQQQVNQGIAMAEEQMGLKIRDDILAKLGDGWVFYISPSRGGIIITGFTMIVEATDAEAAGALSDQLKRLVSFIDGQAGPGVVRTVETSYKDHPIHYASAAGFPLPVAPAWGVHGKHLIIGLYPQVVMQAMDQLTAPSKSILDNPDFARGRKHMPEKCTAVVYSDTKAAMTDVYRILLPLLTAGGGLGQQFGFDIDATLIPTCDTFTGNLYGDVAATTADDNGFMFTCHGPLPIAMAGIAAPIAVAALTSSIALPGLASARHQAKQSVDTANARAIVLACQMYAEDNQGQFPPDLETLVTQGFIEHKTLHSLRDPVEGRVSYVYMHGQSQDGDPNAVLIHERLNIGDPIVVGFVGGEVRAMPLAEASRLLESSQSDNEP